MDIIINTNCPMLPNGSKELPSEGESLLNLLVCLDYQRTNPPLAQLLAHYHKLEGEWLILSPSQWQASHNNVMISAFGEHLACDEQELNDCFHRFSEHLISQGIALYYHNAFTWLLSSNHKQLLKAQPINHLLGKPLMLELATLDETMYWQKFLTESQMFLSTQYSNPVINGVWLWGGAALEDKRTTRIATNSRGLPFAKLLSTQACLYETNHSLTEYDLLLLDDISELNKTHQEQLQKRVTRWYWNDTAYECAPVSWYQKIWRTLTHAP